MSPTLRMPPVAWLRARASIIAVLVMVLMFHALSAVYLTAFYAINPPHYDSVGSYTMMYEILTLVQQGAWQTAWQHAAQAFLSWLQAYFALLGAPFLERTPASLQALNSLSLLCLMLSIYAAGRAYGASRTKAYMLTLIAFVPDVFYDWWGGALDMRRDYAFVALLAACLFAMFALLWRPTRAISLWFGLCAGLVVFARDNAVFFLLALVGGPLAACALRCLLVRDFKWFRRFGPAAASASLLIVPWLISSLPLALARRLDPFTMYGMGGDPWVSLRYYWSTPFQLLLGHIGEGFGEPPSPWTPLIRLSESLGAGLVIPRLGQVGGGVHGTLPIALSLLSILMASVLIALWIGWLRVSFAKANRAVFCAVVGLWSYAATVFIICFVATARPINSLAAQIPFYPALLAFFALVFASSMLLVAGRRPLSKYVRSLIAVGMSMLVFVYAVLNIEAKSPEATPRFVAIGQELTRVLLAEHRVLTVAFLWHEAVTLDAVAYYAAQQGAPGRFKQLRYPFAGHTLDLQVGVPDGVDPSAMLTALQEHIVNADYVLASTAPGAYARPSHPFLLYQYGQPIVDALLLDRGFEKMMSFVVWGDEVVVLKKRTK